MKIVGLDLSLTATGVALADGSLLTIKTKPNADRMARISEIRKGVLRCLDFLGHGRVDMVVIEGYSMGSRQGSHQLGELGGAIRMMLHDQAVPFVEVAPTRLKKYATGKGNADKDAVLVKAVRTFTPGPANNNEADAAWLRDMAVAFYSEREIPKDRAELLRQVGFPALAHI